MTMGKRHGTTEELSRMGAAVAAALVLHLLFFALLRFSWNPTEGPEQDRYSSPTRITFAAPAPAAPAEDSRPAKAAAPEEAPAPVEEPAAAEPSEAAAREAVSEPAPDRSAGDRGGLADAALPVDQGGPSASPYNPPDIQELFITILHQRIRQNLVYPLSARDRGIEGSVIIRLEIASDGRLLASTLERSSGSRSLDQAAGRLISTLFPFDIQPGQPVRCSVEIVYRLNPA